MASTDAKEIALARFAERFNCAEAVLLGLSEAMGISESCIPRIATAFGGGIGGCGEACGAITGAAMAISLKFGRESAADQQAKSRCYEKVRVLVAEFEREFGSNRCFDLVNCDMRTEEGMARAKELDLHNKVCPKFVAFAADAAQRLLANS